VGMPSLLGDCRPVSGGGNGCNSKPAHVMISQNNQQD